MNEGDACGCVSVLNWVLYLFKEGNINEKLDNARRVMNLMMGICDKVSFYNEDNTTIILSTDFETLKNTMIDAEILDEKDFVEIW